MFRKLATVALAALLLNLGACLGISDDFLPGGAFMTPAEGTRHDLTRDAIPADCKAKPPTAAPRVRADTLGMGVHAICVGCGQAGVAMPVIYIGNHLTPAEVELADEHEDCHVKRHLAGEEVDFHARHSARVGLSVSGGMYARRTARTVTGLPSGATPVQAQRLRDLYSAR